MGDTHKLLQSRDTEVDVLLALTLRTVPSNRIRNYLTRRDVAREPQVPAFPLEGVLEATLKFRRCSRSGTSSRRRIPVLSTQRMRTVRNCHYSSTSLIKSFLLAGDNVFPPGKLVLVLLIC